MNTNRWLTVLLSAALCLACAQAAHAFYNPQTGRWLSRDPIGEQGGRNLYAFIGNEPLQRMDPDGRVTYEDCPPAAQQKIQSAIDEACRRIKSTDFGCCMWSSSLGREYSSKLLYLCNRNFKVKCTLEPESPTGGCASASPRTQTIKIYNIFFSSNACGWGDHACVVGHEMVHLLGPEHERWDRFFNRVHKCLKCPRYKDF